MLLPPNRSCASASARRPPLRLAAHAGELMGSSLVPDDSDPHRDASGKQEAGFSRCFKEAALLLIVLAFIMPRPSVIRSFATQDLTPAAPAPAARGQRMGITGRFHYRSHQQGWIVGKSPRSHGAESHHPMHGTVQKGEGLLMYT